jgi:hypothetical protein
MRYLAALPFAVAALACSAKPLPPVTRIDAASVLAFQHILAETTIGARTYRLITAPYTVGECWGKITSCPNERLLIVVVPSDLYEKPLLFQLPEAKGWQFIKWGPVSGAFSSGTDDVEFTVRTAIPANNVNPEERDRFVPVIYQVKFSAGKAIFSTVK